MIHVHKNESFDLATFNFRYYDTNYTSYKTYRSTYYKTI